MAFCICVRIKFIRIYVFSFCLLCLIFKYGSIKNKKTLDLALDYYYYYYKERKCLNVHTNFEEKKIYFHQSTILFLLQPPLN